MASQKADLQTENMHSQFYEVKQVQQNHLRYQPDQSECHQGQNQLYETINAEEDQLSMVDLQKSRVLLQKYIKNKLSSSLDNGQPQYKTEEPKEELASHLEIENQQDYETQLSQAQNLKKIENMIGEMIKSKIDSSYVTSSECNYSDIDNNIQIEEQQDNYPEDSIINFEPDQIEQSQKIPLEKAELALTVAQTCKEYLPHYSIGNIVCLLKSVLQSSSKIEPKTKNTINLSQQRSRAVSVNATVTTSLPKQKNVRNVRSGRPPKQVPAYEPSQSRISNNSFQSKSKSEISFSSKMAPSKIKVREQVQKQIAYVFVTKGYGLTLAKQHIKEDMDGNKYNSLLTSVIRSALRKLCDILTRNMGQQAKVFDMKEQRLLRSPMVNCRKWLNRSQQHTFFKIINIAYGMNNEPIYQDEVINLYEKLLKQLQKRSQYNKDRAQKKKKVDIIISTSKPNGFQGVSNPNKLKSTNTPSVPVPNIPINSKAGINTKQMVSNQEKPSKSQKSIGDPAIEKEIAQLFVTFKSEDSVYLLLTKRHPKVSWDKKEIKNTLEKLIKIGLKKVLKFKKDHSQNGQQMPSLGLSENLVGKLLTHPLALQVRVAMVQVLMEKTLSSQRTIQLINIINGCLCQLSRSE